MFNISEYLNSPEFKDLLKGHHKDLKEDNSRDGDTKYARFRTIFNNLVSEALYYYQYFIFQKDNVEPHVIENFYEHMRSVAENKDIKFNNDEAKNRMFECFKKNEPFWEEAGMAEMVFKTKIIDSACLFHAFNANFADHVRANGVNPQNKGYDEEELAQMGELLAKYKSGLTLGCSSRSKGRVYYTNRPLESPSYANTSPEWFNQFTGNYFQKGNYEKARESILGHLTRAQIPQEDADRVMSFFEKSWNNFYTPDAKPKIAMIPQPLSDQRKAFIDSVSTIYGDIDSAWNECTYQNNGESEDVLDVSQGELVDVPNVNTMLRELNQEYKMEHQNELPKEGVQQAPITPALTTPPTTSPTTPPTNLNGNGNGGQGDENEGGMER